MTQKQKDYLSKHEQYMRDNAIAISNHSLKMGDINLIAAERALIGIIEYLQEKLNEIRK